jgi:hypothetical protein
MPDHQNPPKPEESKQETMKPKWPPEPDDNAEDRVKLDDVDGGGK